MSVRIIPVYNSKGDAEAYLAYPYLFNRNGEWVGFVTAQRVVYSVLGEYVGTLSADPRILRKRETEYYPRITPPPPPFKISLPATVPLAPLMSELTHSTVDVLLEEPERLHTADSGEFQQDMD